MGWGNQCMPDKILNFDAKTNSKDGTAPVRDFVRTFFENARDRNQTKNEEFSRINKVYHAEMDMTNRDPNLSNIFVPKLYSTIETIVPYFVDALIGIRPYIPIELTQKKYADLSNAITDLLDAYLDDSNFFEQSIHMVKYVVPYGTAFLEALPDYETRKIVRSVPIMAENIDGMPMQMGTTTVTEMHRLLKLVIRAYAPWEIFQDPFARSLDPGQCRGLIKFRGMVSKRQLKKMAERGSFPDFDIDKLNYQTESLDRDDWSRKMALDIGVPLAKLDDDMGILLSYESEDRYIDLFDWEHVLRDQTNPYSRELGGHGGINLTKIINTNTPNPETSWYGIGEGKPLERICHYLNKHWNQTFDNHDMQNEGVIYYAEDAFSVDQLMMIGGNRIPADIGAGQKIQDVIYERPTPGLPRDFYAIPEVLDNMADETSGIHEITRGQTALKEQTAREAVLKRQAGESRIKLKIRMAERMGLGNFGLKALSHIEQFGTVDDFIEKIGSERASILPTVNPALYDGGYHFAFKGSQRMADAQIKRQDAKDLFQLMAMNPTVNQEWLANFVLDKYEVPESERRNAVRPDPQAMQIMAQMQAMGAAPGAETTRGISNGKTIGGAVGYTPTGRDANEKLAVG